MCCPLNLLYYDEFTQNYRLSFKLTNTRHESTRQNVPDRPIPIINENKIEIF